MPTISSKGFRNCPAQHYRVLAAGDTRLAGTPPTEHHREGGTRVLSLRERARCWGSRTTTRHIGEVFGSLDHFSRPNTVPDCKLHIHDRRTRRWESHHMRWDPTGEQIPVGRAGLGPMALAIFTAVA